MEDEPRLVAPVSAMEEQVVLKIQTCTIKQDAPGSVLLGVKELQVQLTCGDFNIETPWKTSGSNFLFEEKLALPENELEFMIFGRGGTQGNVGMPVARALEERDGKLTECDKSTPDKMDPHGNRRLSKVIELKLVPLDDDNLVIGNLVIFLNAPKGSQPAPTASATAQPATGSDAGYGGAGGGGPLLQAVPEAGPEAGPPTGGGAGGATGGAGMEGWEAAAQAADKAADEAQHEQSLPELSSLFAELHKLRSDLKKEQRVFEHRAHECREAEEALDIAREQVLEKSVLLEEVKTLRLNAVDEDRRRLQQVASSK